VLGAGVQLYRALGGGWDPASVRAAAAEGGVGAHGLDALRGEYPSLSLAADLALAKHGAPGFAAAARDRVLSACVDELVRFLSKTLRIPKRDVTLMAGEGFRHKRIAVTGLTPAACAREFRSSGANCPRA
jgi:hypothetical protein